MKRTVSIVLLVCAVVAVYAPALRNGFVWDDTALVLRDPLIRSWRLLPEAFEHFLFVDATASDFYRPIQRLTYMWDYAVFPLQPWGYHLTSIFCHAAAAVALLFCADQLLLLAGVEERRRRLVSLGAALIWAVHPLHSAAVAYVAGRADPLAAFFGFFGLYVGLRSIDASGQRRWTLMLGATALLLLSALSKEMGFVFPLAWVAVLAAQKRWKALALAAAVTAAVVIVYLSLRLPAEHTPVPQLRAPAPLLVRPIVVARAVAEYATLLVFPLHLQMDRDVETHPTGLSDASLTASAWRELQTLAGLILLGLLAWWLIRSRRKQSDIFLCLLLFVVTYLPVSGVYPLNSTAAEHWLYVPSAFLILAIALAVSDRVSQLDAGRSRTGLAIAVVICAALLGARTFVRTFDWRDQRTFLERNIAAAGDSTRMLINLGGLELSEGKLDQAKAHLEEALRREPDQPLAVINLAAVASRRNDFATARDLLARATKMPLVEAQAHELLGVLESKEHGRVDLLRFRLASRTGAPDWTIEKRYVAVLAETGNLAKAIDELRMCLRTQSYRAETWMMLSQLLDRAGATDQAAQAREQAEAYDIHLAARPLPL